MRKHYLLFGLVLLLNVAVRAQVQPGKEYVFNPLKWKIIIPEGTTAVSNAEWNKLEEKGAAALEQTVGEKIENAATTIFVVKYDETNYFEANHQPYDSVADPDYPAYFRSANEVLYATFKEQMPNAIIDTAVTEEQIDGLLFQKFRIKITMANNVVLKIIMYSRPFGNKEFTINMMFIDEDRGFRMMTAWKKSTFGK